MCPGDRLRYLHLQWTDSHRQPWALSAATSCLLCGQRKGRGYQISLDEEAAINKLNLVCGLCWKALRGLHLRMDGEPVIISQQRLKDPI
jgi:hypothetical protein